MEDLSVLREKLLKVNKALNNTGLPEAARPALVKKQAELEKDIAEAEGMIKSKVVKPLAEPKKVVKEKKPKVKVVKPKVEKKAEQLHLIGTVKVDEGIRFPFDERRKCDSYTVEYRDENGIEFRKGFYVNVGEEPIIPKSGTHEELNAKRDQLTNVVKPKVEQGKKKSAQDKINELSETTIDQSIVKDNIFGSIYLIMFEALTDANFHLQAKKLGVLFGFESPSEVYKKLSGNEGSKLDQAGQFIASKCDWEYQPIIDVFKYYLGKHNAFDMYDLSKLDTLWEDSMDKPDKPAPFKKGDIVRYGDEPNGQDIVNEVEWQDGEWWVWIEGQDKGINSNFLVLAEKPLAEKETLTPKIPYTPHKYHYYEDPGHGWMEVPLSEIKALGIESEISSYSYKRGDNVYLEEDSDRTTFLKAGESAGWFDIQDVLNNGIDHTTNNDSPVRGYSSYVPPKKTEKQEPEKPAEMGVEIPDWITVTHEGDDIHLSFAIRNDRYDGIIEPTYIDGVYGVMITDDAVYQSIEPMPITKDDFASQSDAIKFVVDKFVYYREKQLSEMEQDNNEARKDGKTEPNYLYPPKEPEKPAKSSRIYPHPHFELLEKAYLIADNKFDRNWNIERIAYDLAGDNYKETRQEIMSAIKGEKVPIAKSGVMELMKEFKKWIDKYYTRDGKLIEPEGTEKSGMEISVIDEGQKGTYYYIKLQNSVNSMFHTAIFSKGKQNSYNRNKQADIDRLWILAEKYPLKVINEEIEKENAKQPEPEHPKHLTRIDEIPKLVREFMPVHQQRALVSMKTFEHWGIFKNIEEQVKALPKLYGTEGIKSEDKIAQLHYFYGGSDWFINEGSMDGDDEDAQFLFFGYAILNGDTQMSEYGYIPRDELVNRGKVELDFFWEPETMNQVFKEKYPSLARGGEPEDKPLGNPILDELAEELVNKRGFVIYNDKDPLFTKTIGDYRISVRYDAKRSNLQGKYVQISNLREAIETEYYSEIQYLLKATNFLIKEAKRRSGITTEEPELNTIELARELGKKAHRSGKSRTPNKDADFTEFIKSLEIEEDAFEEEMAYYRAWREGWWDEKKEKEPEIAPKSAIPNIDYFKTWSQIVVNPGKENSSYDNKAPKDWDGDDFVGFVKDSIDNDDCPAIGSDSGHVIVKLLGITDNTSVINYYNQGSGLNNDEEFKKYDNWRASLYDVWKYLKSSAEEPEKTIDEKIEDLKVKIIYAKDFHPEKVGIYEDQLAELQKKENPELKGYAKSIVDDTGCDPSDAEEIEEIMRHDIFHSTLDWQSKAEFKKGAIEAYEQLKFMRSPEGIKYMAEISEGIDRGEIETPKPDVTEEPEPTKAELEAILKTTVGLLPYVEGEEKKDVEAYIKGLKILVKMMNDETESAKEPEKPKRPEFKRDYCVSGTFDLHRLKSLGISNDHIAEMTDMYNEVANRVGDRGSCVLGNGIMINGKRVIGSYAQGSLGLEEIQGKIIPFLKKHYPNLKVDYAWGNMD